MRNLYFKTGYEEYISGFHRFFEQTILLYLDGYLELKFYHNQKSLLKIEEALKFSNSSIKQSTKITKEYFEKHIIHLVD